MIVVSDTSAITSLIQIGREHLLSTLFTRALIPPAVRDELEVFHKELPGFLEVIDVRDVQKVSELLGVIDQGEAEAIILAEECLPDYLLIDDLAARDLAAQRNLPVIGLLGVLVMARRAGLVNSLAKVIAELETVAGFRISVELKKRVLALSGE